MVLKKIYFPIFYFILLFFCLISCETNIKNDSTYLTHFNKAENHFEKGEYDSAFYHFEKVKSFCASKNDLDNIIYPILIMSEIQRIKNDFSGCEETVTEALRYIKKDTKISYLTFIYNNLGIAFLEQANYTEAQKYYEKSLGITSDEFSKCIIKNNIAVNYLKQNKFQEAENLLELIKNNNSLRKNPIERARVLDNLGYVKFKLNDLNSRDDLLFAKKIREANNDEVGLIATSIHLAEFYEKTNINLANDFALKAYKYSLKVKSPDDKLEALQYLTRVSTGEKAKNYALKSFLLNDSIKKVKQQAKNQFAKIKYDSKQTLKELEKQKQLKEFSVIGIILLFSIGAFAYYRIKNRNRKKIKETAYLTETRIAKKLHDELANDVHNAIAFAETQDLEIPTNKEVLLENLDTIYTRTRSISSENKDVDTEGNYLEKLKAMIASYSSNNINVILNTASLDEKKINKEIKIVIYRVLQELMVNMKKHSNCSIVSIGFKSDKKTIEINYSDNGIGCTNLLNLKSGLQNAENRIFSVNGNINFDTEPEKGFKVKISIPK